MFWVEPSSVRKSKACQDPSPVQLSIHLRPWPSFMQHRCCFCKINAYDPWHPMTTHSIEIMRRYNWTSKSDNKSKYSVWLSHIEGTLINFKLLPTELSWSSTKEKQQPFVSREYAMCLPSISNSNSGSHPGAESRFPPLQPWRAGAQRP